LADRGSSLAAPGTYHVQFFARDKDQTRPLSEPQPFQIVSVINPTLPATDAQEIIAFQRAAGKLQIAVAAAGKIIETANAELGQIRELVQTGRVKEMDVLDSVRKLELSLADAQELLFGDQTAPRRFADGKPSIAARVGNALFGTLGQTHGPTKTHRDQLAIAQSEYDQVIAQVRQAVESDLERLRARLDEIGAPWTPGRKIPPARTP
jgi:hypothetical protein